MTSSTKTTSGAEQYGDTADQQLRPRAWKRNSNNLLGGSGRTTGHLHDGLLSEPPSGASTPIPENAPPSVQSLHTARKQVRAAHRRLFPTVDYTWRLSHFDPKSDHTDFHGFYNLFWIGLGIMAITTMLRNLKDTGQPFNLRIWALFASKPQHLALADLAMVASTAVCLPAHRLWWRPAPQGSAWTWGRGGMAAQSAFQLAWMALWTGVPFYFDWTWTAQVAFELHTMVILMKMHSYAFYNGHLSETEKRLRALDMPGPARRKVLKEPAYVYPSTDEPAVDERGLPMSPKNRASWDVAKQVRAAAAAAASANRSGGGKKDGIDAKDAMMVEGVEEEGQEKQKQQQQQHDETAHSSSGEEVDELRDDLATELTSPLGNVTYPANLTWANYLDFLLCPTLCYELEYPRTPSVDWYVFGSKVAATFGCIFLLTVVSEDFIVPVLLDANARLNPVTETLRPSPSETLLVLAETISWLLFPFMVTFLLVFLVIFEYVLGAFAELTRFADRHFYSDWWNSTDWMEFSREWNVPVHAFLRRHVYSASRPHVGRRLATVVTFLISAVGHEIVMACITKKLRGYGFVCQMLQLPIVVLQRTKWVRGKRTLNNAMFWCSIILGLSLICSLYVLI